MQKPSKLFYAVGVGILSGLAATIFLFSLNHATHFRQNHETWVYALPLIGLVIGCFDHYWGRDIKPGTALILDEISNPKKVLPLKMAPSIFITTILTHLFGGSAGREGTVIQMGASISDQLSRIFRVQNNDRKLLLIAGASSGFAAALGCPFAGILFGTEVMRTEKWQVPTLLFCSIASFSGYLITQALHAPHTVFPPLTLSSFSWAQLLWVTLASIIFALIVRVFIGFTHQIEKVFEKIKIVPLKPFVGGMILVVLYQTFSWQAFEGLGLETIMHSFNTNYSPSITVIKIFVTALTLGTGFKGGEFIPLVFMGATAGSAIAIFSPEHTFLLAALGCAATFGCASKTPLTCTILAIEWFGWKIAPFALFTCYLSYFLSGHISIYRRKHVS